MAGNTKAVAKRSQATVKSRIFLVDRYALARAGLRSLIEAQTDLTVCGELPTCQASLPTVATARPNLVVLEPFCRSGCGTGSDGNSYPLS